MINFDERTVTVSSKPVRLTATEYKLLTELSGSAGRGPPAGQPCFTGVWGPEYSGEAQLLACPDKVSSHKLGDNARSPTYIFTEHGVGYRMAKPSPQDNRP